MRTVATLQELIARVRDNVYDPEGRRWSDATITTYLNEALANLKPFSYTLVPFTVDVPANTDIVGRPSGLLAPNRAYFRIGTEQWELGVHSGIPEDTEDVAGFPEDLYIAGSNLYLRPVPARDGVLTIVGTARPSLLFYPTDTPSYEDVDHILAAYATWWLWYTDGNIVEAERWRDVYMTLRTEWAVLDAQRNPSTNNISREWW